MPSALSQAQALINLNSWNKLTAASEAGLEAVIANVIATENEASAVLAENSEADAELSLVLAGTVTAVVVTDPGDNYDDVVTVAFTPAGGGSNAAATATMKVVSVTVAEAGVGYAVNQPLTLATGTGTAATFKVTAVNGVGGITGLSIVGGGSYSVLPDLTDVAVGGLMGSGALVDVTMGVNTVTVTNAGSGYDDTVSVAFNTGGAGSGATGTVTIRGAIASITVDDGGSGYVSGATATVLVNTSTGTGFVCGTVTLTADAVTAVAVTNGGSGFALTDTLTIVGGYPAANIRKRLLV